MKKSYITHRVMHTKTFKNEKDAKRFAQCTDSVTIQAHRTNNLDGDVEYTVYFYVKELVK